MSQKFWDPEDTSRVPTTWPRRTPPPRRAPAPGYCARHILLSTLRVLFTWTPAGGRQGHKVLVPRGCAKRLAERGLTASPSAPSHPNLALRPLVALPSGCTVTTCSRCPHCGGPVGPDGTWKSRHRALVSKGGQSQSPAANAARRRNAVKARARYLALRARRPGGRRRIRRRSYTAAGLAG